jgi:hypothetical protein
MTPLLLLFASTAGALQGITRGPVLIGNSFVPPLSFEASVTRADPWRSASPVCLRFIAHVPSLGPQFKYLRIGGIAGALDPKTGQIPPHCGGTFKFETGAAGQTWTTEIPLVSWEDVLQLQSPDGKLMFGIMLTSLALGPERLSSSTRQPHLHPDFVAWGRQVTRDESNPFVSSGDARADAGDARAGAGDARAGAGDARAGAGDTEATAMVFVAASPSSPSLRESSAPTCALSARPSSEDPSDGAALRDALRDAPHLMPRAAHIAHSPREKDRVEGALAVLAAAIRRREPEELKALLCSLMDLTAQSLNAISESRQCIVCMDSPKAAIIMPCAHRVCCVTCSKRATTCPLCRGPVVRVVERLE